MQDRDNKELLLLLDDYGRSVSRRASGSSASRLAPSEHPLWLEARSFEARLRWQSSRHPALPLRVRPDEPAPEFDAARFDPWKRFSEARGSEGWAPDTRTPLRLETDWRGQRSHAWRVQSTALSVAAHAVVLALLFTPRVMQLDVSEPADWNSLRITLIAPPLDDLPPLRGESKVPGDGEGGFRGMQQPSITPPPVPEPALDAPPAPEQERPAPEPVAQPVETEEPGPSEEPPALAEAAEPEVAEPPVAQSPSPGEFRQGPELALDRDPRLLPMPKAPSRKRAALQLEDPRARMPSHQGSPQLGALELAARPGQMVQGAIQQMIRDGGPRQAVGDGAGGIASPARLPSRPSHSGSRLELLSDPRGVDFRPYLTQLLAAVRRNWLAVIPESARLGMSQGRTLIQFSVARGGAVPKLVIAKSSGSSALDRAAVAGISASNPFPPLPGEYLGGDIRLQFTFLYNIRNP